MVEVNTSQKEVKIVREFAGIEAYKAGESLRIAYREQTLIDGEIIKDEVKTYTRDYNYWEASQIGQAILQLISLDLVKPDPSVSGSTQPEE